MIYDKDGDQRAKMQKKIESDDILPDSRPNSTFKSARWPELDTGRNSVIPCTIPSMIDCSSVIFSLRFLFAGDSAEAARRTDMPGCARACEKLIEALTAGFACRLSSVPIIPY